ncbi:hypothetical protein TURU_078358 [Turdus rufiventris]|nr:hypothetical protein TURU_078358 [Turdus rufiventris]
MKNGEHTLNVGDGGWIPKTFEGLECPGQGTELEKGLEPQERLRELGKGLSLEKRQEIYVWRNISAYFMKSMEHVKADESGTAGTTSRRSKEKYCLCQT